MLRALAAHLKYEVAIGLNGAVWLRAATARDAVIVANALENAELLEVSVLFLGARQMDVADILLTAEEIAQLAVFIVNRAEVERVPEGRAVLAVVE